MQAGIGVLATNREDTMTTVRQFNRAGPCIVLGQLTSVTPQFFCFDEWQGGDHYVSKRVRRELPGRWSPNHVIPCRSCRDHPQTQYPDGYND
jgi:hypothetical protein